MGAISKPVGRSWSVAFAAIVVLVAVVVLTASSASSAESQDQGYSVLNQPRTTEDVVATSVTANAMADRIGITPESSQFVMRRGTVNVYVVGRSGGACLLALNDRGAGSASCSTSRTTAVTGGWHGSVGLVPDDVTSVTYTLTDGSTEVAAVRGNVWKAPLEAAWVQFVTTGDSRRIELMPRSTLPDNLVLCDDGTTTPRGTSCGSLTSGAQAQE